MQKPECISLGGGRLVTKGKSFFEETKSSIDIGANEIVRAVDGAVHVAFGGKMNNGVRPVRQKQLGDQLAIANVALQKFVLAVRGDGGEIGEVAGVSQLVESDDVRGRIRQP